MLGTTECSESVLNETGRNKWDLGTSSVTHVEINVAIHMFYDLSVSCLSV